jgi:hypothetical protein
LQSLASSNPHWARVASYGPFSLWVINKEGMCPSSGGINRLMMVMITTVIVVFEKEEKKSTHLFPLLNLVKGD